MNTPKLPIERLFRAAVSSQEVDDFLRATIELFVEVAGTTVGVIRVDDGIGLRSRASVGLEEEVQTGFTSPSETVECSPSRWLRLPTDDQRVSGFMRQAGIRAAYWLTVPHHTLPLAICFGTDELDEIPVARVSLLETLAPIAAGAVGCLHERRALERTLREREQCLADIAHDLKNSINAVALSTTVLEQRLEPASPHHATITRIARNTRRAAGVVENLLSSSIIEAGKLVLGQVALEPAELVLSATQAQHDAGARAGIVISPDLAPGLPEVRGDTERLLEVFDNLVGNALRFTKSGGTIKVGAALRDDHVLFWVKDTGSGIPAEELTRIFERYWRAKPTDRKSSGLGLSICKGIVEAHGGRIWAESSVGLGTTMLFTLPVLEARSSVRPPALENVLIVDDRRQNLQALEAILEGAGYRTLTATSGREALHVALQEELSVVLLDIEMPEMDGFEIARQLKQVRRTRSIPIIFVTAYGDDPEQVYRAYAAGGADYLVKPLDPEIVRRKVAALAELGRRRAPREPRAPSG